MIKTPHNYDEKNNNEKQNKRENTWTIEIYFHHSNKLNTLLVTYLDVTAPASDSEKHTAPPTVLLVSLTPLSCLNEPVKPSS